MLYEFLAYGPNGGLGSIGNPNLPQDVLDVLLHGLVADLERLSNLLVRQPKRKLPKNFALALGQRNLDVGRKPGRRQGAGHAPQFLSRPRALAGHRRMNGLHQFVARATFQQVAARPQGHRAGNVRGVVVGRENDDGQVGMVVDSVVEVTRINVSAIETAPPITKGVDAYFLSGVAKINERLIIMLNLERALSPEAIKELDAIKVEDQDE